MPTSVDSGGNIMPISSNSRDTLHAYKCAQGTSLMPASLDSGVTTSARALQRYKMSLHLQVSTFKVCRVNQDEFQNKETKT
jgi:hypothetical protein